ncbi:MAG: PAS domain-containing protein, partial [Pseudomonadota bacterium]
RQALVRGEGWFGETINYRKDGSPYNVEWRIAPVRNGHDRITHWVSTQRDITQQREAGKCSQVAIF